MREMEEEASKNSHINDEELEENKTEILYSTGNREALFR